MRNPFVYSHSTKRGQFGTIKTFTGRTRINLPNVFRISANYGTNPGGFVREGTMFSFTSGYWNITLAWGKPWQPSNKYSDRLRRCFTIGWYGMNPKGDRFYACRQNDWSFEATGQFDPTF